MINFTSKTRYYISSNPTDMRNGRDGLAGIVREVMGHNPKCYDEAFIYKPLPKDDGEGQKEAA